MIHTKDRIYKQLNRLGLPLLQIGELGYMFHFKKTSFLYLPDHYNTQSVHLAIPYFLHLSSEIRQPVLELINQTNQETKYTKLHIMSEHEIWLSYQYTFEGSTPIKKILLHMINLMSSTHQIFAKRLSELITKPF